MTPGSGPSLGRYRLQGCVGVGGMAEVYRAEDAVLGRTVAVKVMRSGLAEEPHFLERFLREARVVAQLDHPHILPVFDFGEQEGRPFLVMPFLSGGTLGDFLDGPRSLVETATWTWQLASALDAAHAAGVLHRDVKPSNVLIGAEGRLVLADFGIARLMESTTRVTATGVMVGTPAFMAPELARGEPASEATDRYALAVLIYEILAGAPPFAGENALAVLHQQVHAPVPPISHRVPHLPSSLDAFFATALAKDPAGRPAPCSRLAEGLVERMAAGEREEVQRRLAAGSSASVVAAGGPHGTWLPAAGGSPAPTVSRDGETLGTAPTLALGPEPSRRRPWIRSVSLGAGLVVLGAVGGLLAYSRLASSGPRGPRVVRAVASPRTEPRDAVPPAVEGAPEGGGELTGSVQSPSGSGEGGLEAPTEPQSPPAVLPATTPRAFQSPVASPPGARGNPRFHPGTEAIGSLEIFFRRPERRLTKSDFAAVRERAREAPTRSKATALAELWAVAGAAYLAGDDGRAREILKGIGTQGGHPPAWVQWLPLVSREAGKLEGWELALIFGDARQEGLVQVREARSRRPDDLRLRMAEAFFLHLHGEHREALEIAAAVHGEVASREAAGHREEVAQFAALECLDLADWGCFQRWLDPALGTVEPGDTRFVAQAATLVRDRLDDRQRLRQLLQTACRKGLPWACRQLLRRGP